MYRGWLFTEYFTIFRENLILAACFEHCWKREVIIEWEGKKICKSSWVGGGAC